jgi:hypothetical protein
MRPCQFCSPPFPALIVSDNFEIYRNIFAFWQRLNYMGLEAREEEEEEEEEEDEEAEEEEEE